MWLMSVKEYKDKFYFSLLSDICFNKIHKKQSLIINKGVFEAQKVNHNVDTVYTKSLLKRIGAVPTSLFLFTECTLYISWRSITKWMFYKLYITTVIYNI